jgi:hypothetical protein
MELVLQSLFRLLCRAVLIGRGLFFLPFRIFASWPEGREIIYDKKWVVKNFGKLYMIKNGWLKNSASWCPAICSKRLLKHQNTWYVFLFSEVLQIKLSITCNK